MLGILGFLLFLFFGPLGHARSRLQQSAQGGADSDRNRYATAGAQSQRSRRKWLWWTVDGLVLKAAASRQNSGSNGPGSADERYKAGRKSASSSLTGALV